MADDVADAVAQRNRCRVDAADAADVCFVAGLCDGAAEGVGIAGFQVMQSGEIRAAEVCERAPVEGVGVIEVGADVAQVGAGDDAGRRGVGGDEVAELICKVSSRLTPAPWRGLVPVGPQGSGQR